MIDTPHKVFLCFAAEDRYTIAEPIAYHLINYGIDVWYDRHTLLMSDNRRDKNLIEGAARCNYSVIIISKYTESSICAMEEISIVENNYRNGQATIFPVLYDITPDEIPTCLQWIKELIFKEASKSSGTREICNHIACKITKDLLEYCRFKTVQDITQFPTSTLPIYILNLLNDYHHVDRANLNSRVSLLYAVYLYVKSSIELKNGTVGRISRQVFERLFTETKLNIDIDYRELWLLENALCLIVETYLNS